MFFLLSLPHRHLKKIRDISYSRAFFLLIESLRQHLLSAEMGLYSDIGFR